jgi:hypothetical protein
VRDELSWVWDPTPTNPEHIHIRGGWPEANIKAHRFEALTVLGVDRPISVNHLAIVPFEGWFAELAKLGLLRELGPFNGCWAPRFVRQSGTLVQRRAKCAILAKHHRTDRLSNHTWGLAMDFDAKHYPLGKPVPADDVRHELARIAKLHGIAWGGHYKHRPDGMHWELVP